jgi:hypothetical protein
MFRNHTRPPSAWCPICEQHVTNLATHMANEHPVR